MDISTLLQAHGDESPSGENLEYDPDFTAMELAAQQGEERQVGDEIIAPEEPDYRAVVENAQAVIARSHDLRAGIHIANAQLRLSGLPGFAEATSYVRGCLEQHWDSCHPQLDDEDDNDPTMRVNAVLALADEDSVVKGLRRVALTDSRTFGKINLRHIAIAQGDITPREDEAEVVDNATVAAAFQDTDPEQNAAMREAAQVALGNIVAIGAKFDAEVPGQGPNFDLVIKTLNQILASLGEEPETAEPEATAAQGETSEGTSKASGGGGISSPADVQAALDRIIAYYARHEPSSPVPLLLTRAKRLVSADFITIMKDMAPSGVENVNLIGGIAEEGYE